MICWGCCEEGSSNSFIFYSIFFLSQTKEVDWESSRRTVYRSTEVSMEEASWFGSKVGLTCNVGQNCTRAILTKIRASGI